MAVAVKAAAAASAASHAGGGVNVLLRYPVVVGHEIGPDSPIRGWMTPDGMLKVHCAASRSCVCVEFDALCVCEVYVCPGRPCPNLIYMQTSLP